KGITILNDVDSRMGRGEDAQVHAELMHARGHLHVAKYLVSGLRDESERQEAVQSLRVAAELNPGYTSCLTSCHSEMGDHLSTVLESLEALGKRAYLSLKDEGGKEAQVVESEVIFYLGNAYLGLGENGLALRCFEEFIEKSRALRNLDAEHHGTF